MSLTTLSYRIKNETTGKHLVRMSHSVNFVWNFCNQSNSERWAKFKKTFTAFDLNNLTAGCAKELGLHSQTIQAVCEEYISRCKQVKRSRLTWRSRKRSLGWIPFKAGSVKIQADTVTYYGHKFRFWLSRPIEGVVRFGSFSQDSKGNWFVNFLIDRPNQQRIKTGKE